MRKSPSLTRSPNHRRRRSRTKSPNHRRPRSRPKRRFRPNVLDGAGRRLRRFSVPTREHIAECFDAMCLAAVPAAPRSESIAPDQLQDRCSTVAPPDRSDARSPDAIAPSAQPLFNDVKLPAKWTRSSGPVHSAIIQRALTGGPPNEVRIHGSSGPANSRTSMTTANANLPPFTGTVHCGAPRCRNCARVDPSVV